MRNFFGLTLLAVVGMTTVALAQPPSPQQQQQQEKFTNLKVLDSTIERQKLITIMRGIAGGLGVHCDYCHVQAKGPNGEEKDDFASDSNNMKLVAREMMKMTHLLNSQMIPNAVKDTVNLVTVECVTCHRGQPLPRLIQDVLTEAYKAGGTDSLLHTYSSLRDKYYGRQTFDFADYVLSQVGSDISQQDKPGGVKILEYNTTLYPNSAGAWFSLGRVYAESGDKEKARTAFQSALKANPDFRPAKQMLDMLDKGMPPKQ